MRGQERFFTLDYSGLVWITRDYSGSQKSPPKRKICLVFEKVRKGSESRRKPRSRTCVSGSHSTSGVQKEGSLVSSAAMRRGHTHIPPLYAVPPSQGR